MGYGSPFIKSIFIDFFLLRHTYIMWYTHFCSMFVIFIEKFSYFMFWGIPLVWGIKTFCPIFLLHVLFDVIFNFHATKVLNEIRGYNSLWFLYVLVSIITLTWVSWHLKSPTHHPQLVFYLFNSSFKLTTKKCSILLASCVRNPMLNCGFLSQRGNNADSASMS